MEMSEIVSAPETASQPRVWLKRLRVGMSLLCLVLAVAFAGLWAHSYSSCGAIRKQSDEHSFILTSWRGGIQAVVNRGKSVPPSVGWRTGFVPSMELDERFLRPIAFRFRFQVKADSFRAAAPHWLFVIVFGILAVILKPKPRLRFSLRELLVAVAVAAIALGSVEAVVRAWTWPPSS